jgi:hypothetical protein
MNRDTKNMMRILLVLLLFQFVSPSLFSIVTLGSVSEDAKTVVTPAHSSIVTPVFLKEQEEREHEETYTKPYELTSYIDFCNHSLSHTVSQSIIYKEYNQQDKLSCHPPLFKLHSTFLI